MPVQIKAKALSLQIKTKEVKVTLPEGETEYLIVRLGRLTLEFDADGVNMEELANFVNGRLVSLGLADTQYQLPEES